MSSVVLSIVEVSMNKIASWIGVGEDNSITEWATIASNDYVGKTLFEFPDFVILFRNLSFKMNQNSPAVCMYY